MVVMGIVAIVEEERITGLGEVIGVKGGTVEIGEIGCRIGM